jgi:hypothetical protein
VSELVPVVGCTSKVRGKFISFTVMRDHQSQSQSYLTNGGLRPISSSCLQAPIGSWPEFFSIDPLRS